jgi:hypothetical protein
LAKIQKVKETYKKPFQIGKEIMNGHLATAGPMLSTKASMKPHMIVLSILSVLSVYSQYFLLAMSPSLVYLRGVENIELE